MGSLKKRFLKDKRFVVLSLGLLLLLVIAYANHFSNPFYFDDFHSVVNNTAKWEIKSSDFFNYTNASASHFTNQGDGPLLALENTIDYILGKGFNPKIFHIHIFIMYLGTCLMLFLTIRKLLSIWYSSENEKYYALICTALFGLSYTNAETVNYVSQRGEITASFFVLIGFWTFLKGGVWRKKGLYLIFPLLGFMFEETALAFAALLFFYILLFENEADLLKILHKTERTKLWQSFKSCIPAMLITLAYLIYHTQTATGTFNWANTGGSEGWLTLPYVICHFIIDYFLPFPATTYSYEKIFESFWDYKVVTSHTIFLGILFLILWSSRYKNTRIISFGMIWFFVGLSPISQLLSFNGVLQGNITFLPYMGLTVSFVFGAKLFIKRYFSRWVGNPYFQKVLGGFFLLFLSLNIYGIKKENKVWKNELSLWQEATQKNPKNGLALMNYGMALLKEKEYEKAKECLEKSATVLPSYPGIHVNLGIAKEALGEIREAEKSFEMGISLNPNNYTSLYAFGSFLAKHGRYDEASIHLARSHELAPAFYPSIVMLMEVLHRTENWEVLSLYCEKMILEKGDNKLVLKYLPIWKEKKTLLVVLQEELEKSPSALNHFQLGKEYYVNKRFAQAIYHFREALKLQNDLVEALNLQGLAQLKMGNFKESKLLFKEALALQPNFHEVKQNLYMVENQKDPFILLKNFQNKKSDIELARR